MLHGRNAAGLGGICLETDGRDSAGHALIGRNVFFILRYTTDGPYADGP